MEEKGEAQVRAESGVGVEPHEVEGLGEAIGADGGGGVAVGGAVVVVVVLGLRSYMPPVSQRGSG